ncbi:heme ABC transporter ATP-binding protein [Microbacterium gubbeenense]|uniref:heme ABC transporter ATP-binding protein n=2 Tax=Microbacterium gubbeenense TaxID=159896 RepID=UPI00042914B0|nr:heme ABC transporter ATP-binding protein [Microbacterium gubbeenense]
MSLVARDLGVELDRRRVLSGVSVEVRSGEVLGLIGPNGAGKSTLLRALGGLVRPTTGEVAIDGSRLTSLRPRERAALVAYVAQDTAAAADVTAAELVRMGRYAHRRRLSRSDAAEEEIVRDALEAVGVAHLAERAVPSLSGGERQLVQIARALAQRAGTLLLDEPTSALDVRHQLRVFEILRARADAGVSVAVVLHDLNDASRYCDRLAVLHDGRLVAHGTPESVLTPQRIADVYRIMATVDADAFGYPHIHPTAAHRMPRSAALTGRAP